jgi:CHAD domain-containing protein
MVALLSPATLPAAPPSQGNVRASRRADSDHARWSRPSCELIKNKVRLLFGHFPGAFAGDEESVHQLRVESRRLRVALALVSDNPAGRRTKRARRLLQELIRTAGTSRDLDVLFEIYDEHLKQAPARTPEQTSLRRRLADARRRGRLRMLDALLDLEICQLRADLRELVARGGSPIPVVDERIHELAAREGEALVEGFANIGAQLDPEALHGLRRRARRLRYSVEVAQAIVDDEDKNATKSWKTLQDLIGTIHDHHVLAEWLAKQAASDRKRGKRRLAAAASGEAAWARATMVGLHDRLLASRPGQIVVRGLSLLDRAAGPVRAIPAQ